MNTKVSPRDEYLNKLLISFINLRGDRSDQEKLRWTSVSLSSVGLYPKI